MDEPSLFDAPAAAGVGGDGSPAPAIDPNAPLAARMRPQRLDEVVGQDRLLEPGSPLRRLVEGDAPDVADPVRATGHR